MPVFLSPILLAAFFASAERAESQKALLEQGIAQLQDLEVASAIAILESVKGPLTLEQSTELYENLGLACAYAEQSEKAERAFASLLRIAPGHTLDYSISPKATFIFEKVRKRMLKEPALLVQTSPPSATPYDTPLTIETNTLHNPENFVSSLRLCHRVKQKGGNYDCLDLDLSDSAESNAFVLPPFARPDVNDDEEMTLQFALSGFDAQGNEVYRGPSRARPGELPLGLQPQIPWYENPLTWTAVASATLAAIALPAAWLWMNQPTHATFSTELR